MELFKTDTLRKEFETFNKELIMNVIKCSYCDKRSCQYHKELLISCNFCRTERCSDCHKFNGSRKILYEAADDVGKSYLDNFIVDFLNLSKQSFERYFNEKLNIKDKIQIGKYQKDNEKTAAAVRNNKKNNLNYQIKNKKRSIILSD